MYRDLRRRSIKLKRTARSPPPYLPLELVAAQILVRLPVETLLRFRCICKAWRDAVDDDSFRRAHLRRQKPCLLIAPQVEKTLAGEATTPGLYLWRWEESRKKEATLMHAMSNHPSFFPHEEAVHDLAHCDGLVLLPADSAAARLLNPATRRAVTLPPSPHRPHVVGRLRARGHQAFGLGHDPRSNAYQVARFSYRSPEKLSALGRYTIGMEVLTVRIIPTVDQQPAHCWRWRETSTPPPYPVMPGRTATFFEGSLFFTIDESLLSVGTVSPGFMRFRLEDESFRVTPPPPCRRRIDYLATTLAELSGELCLCVPQEFVPDDTEECYEVWVCRDMDLDEGRPRWERRHVIVGYPVYQGFRWLRPMAVAVDDAAGSSMLLYGGGCHLCRCDRRSYHTTWPWNSTNFMTLN